MPHIEVLDQKKVIGIEMKILYPEQDEKNIPKLWQRFHSENISQKIPSKISECVLALYTDYIKRDRHPAYTLVIGCEVSSLDEIPKGLVGKNIPPAAYEVFRCKGKFPESLIKTWEDIRTRPMKRTYTGDFELYPQDFDPQGHHAMDVYVAVET